VATAVAAAPHATAASAHPALPPRSAASLLAAVEASDVQSLSGTIRTTASLGLPQLPDNVASASAGWAALLTGTHQLRVWVDGADRQRIALLGDLAETDVIHDGTQLWTWSSATQAVSHQTVSSSPRATSGDRSPDAAEQLTPQAQAAKALDAINPSTEVSVDRTARVAGRPAYQLVLTPRTSATLIGSVRIAIDAARSVPLRVQIYAAGSSTPAFQTGFTSISFHRPVTSVFRFTPPAGSHITSTPTTRADREPGTHDTGDGQAKPTTIGSGWTAVLELPAGTVDLSASPDRRDAARGTSIAGALNDITAAVPQGRLLTTRLLTALIAPDGRVFIGAVPATTLERVAGA
jgi:outer membrane lipoprotein-sorting protein